jgi:hypothetical protein
MELEFGECSVELTSKSKRSGSSINKEKNEEKKKSNLDFFQQI